VLPAPSRLSHQRREPPRYGEPKPGAPETPPDSDVRLHELIEDALLHLGRHAHAGVAHRDAQPRLRRPLAFELGLDADVALFRELGRVGEEVEQDAVDPDGIATQRRVAREAVDEFEAEPLLLGLRAISPIAFSRRRITSKSERDTVSVSASSRA